MMKSTNEFEYGYIGAPNAPVTEKTAHPNPEGKIPLTVFELVLAPALPKGVAVFRDKDGKEVGRITNIGE